MAGGSGFQPRFIRAIAVKNRCHNQKQQIQKPRSFFPIRPAVISVGGGARTLIIFRFFCIVYQTIQSNPTN